MSHANVAVFVPHVGCPNRCSFCDQGCITGERQAPNGAFVRETCETALRQMKARGASTKEAQLAFFGGSFTAIERALRMELLEAAAPFLGPEGFGGGIRISTRPDAIDYEILNTLRRCGVTAIELGAQSMDDAVLQKNRRGHTARQVEEAAKLIRAHGFELGLQTMTGLYGDTDAGAYETARILAALQPDTMRIYPTVLLRGTYLAELWESGEYAPPTVEDAVRVASGLLRFFEERDIRVIRVGLHASPSVERDMLGGGYHPALRELCEARLFLEELLAALERGGLKAGPVRVFVPKGCFSKATGQHRSNVKTLQERGFRVTITEDSTLSGRQVRAEAEA